MEAFFVVKNEKQRMSMLYHICKEKVSELEWHV